MSLDGIKNFVTSKAARQILVAQKHSPKVLFVAGTVGVITATALACRATLKVSAVLDDHEKRQANLEGALDVRSEAGNTEGSAVDRITRNLAQLKVQTGLQIAKLYAPAIAVGAVSIAALTGSHIVLTKRNAGAMAAYAGLDRAYKEYRDRVSKEYGEDVDRKFASGGYEVEVEEKLADGTVRKDVKVKKSAHGGSPYAVVFDEHSKRFTREPGMNAMIVQMQQSYANDKLRAQGHLFLNEVYDMLGLPRTKAGAVVGWVWRRENEEKTGDNYVSFGVFDGDQERAEAFIDGDESAVWLDFNVDGMILDLI